MNERQDRIESDPETALRSAPRIAERWRFSVDLVRQHIASEKLATL